MPAYVHESTAPQGWRLLGSIATSALLLRTGNSLTLIHRSGMLSSRIRFAMLAKSVLPKVEITGPNGKVTLINAKVVNVVPHFPGVTHSQGGDTHDQERVSFTFQKIEISSPSSGAAGMDNWSTGTSGHKGKKK